MDELKIDFLPPPPYAEKEESLRFPYTFPVRSSATTIERFPASLQPSSSSSRSSPVAVAIGPYHHGSLEDFCRSRSKQCEEVRGNVLSLMGSARSCYAGDRKLQEMEDIQFAHMMFLDGWFLLQFMVSMCPNKPDALPEADPLMWRPEVHTRLDDIARDVLLLENQVPWIVLEALMELWPAVPVDGFLCLMASAFHVGNEDAISEEPTDLRREHSPNHDQEQPPAAAFHVGNEDTINEEPTDLLRLRGQPPNHVHEQPPLPPPAFHDGNEDTKSEDPTDLRRGHSPIHDHEQQQQPLPPAILVGNEGIISENPTHLRRGHPPNHDHEPPPPHLLGLFYCRQVGVARTESLRVPRLSSISTTAVELAEIGVKLTASNTNKFGDMSMSKRRPGLSLSGELSLAPLVLNDLTACWLVNMAAYETCLGATQVDNFAVSSYISLVALLMNRKEDTQELRTKGIINSAFCDKQTLGFFKGLAPRLHVGHRYYQVFQRLQEYKQERWVWIAVHRFFYKNMKTILAVLSVAGVLAGLFKAILSVKQPER